MKVGLLNFLFLLLIPIFSNAASFNENEKEIDNDNDNEMDYVNLPEVELWEVTLKALPIPEIKTEPKDMGWSISSFLGPFLFSTSSKIPSSSSDILTTSSITESEAVEFASLLKCSTRQLSSIEESTLRMLNLKDLSNASRLEIISKISKLGHIRLFELYAENNLSNILSELKNSRDYHALIFSSIEAKSLNIFFTIINKQIFILNAPQALVFAAMSNSQDILKFIIENNSNSNTDFEWVWNASDRKEGFMNSFGPDPFSAALSLGASRCIQAENLDCLNLIISSGLDVTYREYWLLKESAVCKNCRMFEVLSQACAETIPKSILNLVLIQAVKSENLSLIECVLNFDVNLNLDTGTGSTLIDAINTNNLKIFEAVFSRISHNEINAKVLNTSAEVGNFEIFVALIKVATSDLVLTAVCSCIANIKYQHLIPFILENAQLSTDIMAQGLTNSVKIGSKDLVFLFLQKNECTRENSASAFKEALLFDNYEITYAIVAKFGATFLIQKISVPKILDILFNCKAWNSLTILAEYFFELPSFHKQTFISKIILTDKVNIAKIAAKKGARFCYSELINVSDTEMRTFVTQMLRDNFNKS